MYASKIGKPLLWSSAILTAAGGAYVLKGFLGGPDFHEDINLEGKVAIVTGASSGIGKEVAKGLAMRGAKVILACRDREKCERARENIVMNAQNKYVYCRYCDLSSQESIMKFARRINNEMDKVDILVNNAGVMACPKELTKEGIELQLGVNHMGHFLLTNLILDKLKAGASSRIVNLISIAYKRGKINVDDLNSDKSYSPDMAFNQSCLANALFTRELAKKLEGTSVTVNGVNPGITDTNINRHKTGAWYFTKWVTYPLIWPFIKSAEHGSWVVIHAALSEYVQDVSGKFIGSDREVEDFSGEALRDDLAQWLWLADEKWTKLDENLALSKLPVQRKPKTKQKSSSVMKLPIGNESVPVISEEKKQNTSTDTVTDESTHVPSFTNPLPNVAA